MTKETRSIGAEIRAKGRRLEGYAALYGVEARIDAGMVETIAKGAFSATLKHRADILALVDHDPARVLARTRSGTLRLSEDTRGLAFDLDLPDTQAGREFMIVSLLTNGNAYTRIETTGRGQGAGKSWRSIRCTTPRLRSRDWKAGGCVTG